MENMHTLIARTAFGLAVIGCAGCTDGAPGSLSGSAPGVTTIEVSLTMFAPTTIAQGRAGGYSPVQIVVPVGTQLRFTNVDTFAHTASAVGASATFPQSSPLTASALTPSLSVAKLSSRSWSSGNVIAGASSPVFLADAPGTYIFGCFYHYGAPMRGAIVVR